MARFDKVELSPDLKRLNKVFLEQVRLMFQGYLDESSVDPDTGCIEGMLITPEEAVQFVNDAMLYCQGGEELTESQKVKPGNE